MSKKIKFSTKTWFSLFLTAFLFGAIAVTQIATQNIRDNRSQAATCAAGQSQLTFRPSSDVSGGLWAKDVNNGGYYTKVDEGTSDGDTSYLWDDTIGSGSVLILGHPAASLGSNYAINNVTIGATLRQLRASQTGPFIEMGLQINGILYFSPGTKYHPPPNNAYATTQYSWNTNPATGGAWTLAAVNSANIAVRSTRASQPNEIRLTQTWMESCYSLIPAPTLNFWADSTSLSYNTATTLRWTVTNSTACTASNGWSGAKNSTGSSESTGNLTSQKTYVLTCSGGGGSISRQVVVNVGAAPPSTPSGGTPTPPAAPKPPSSPPPRVTPPSTNPSQQPTVGVRDIKLTFAPNSFLKGDMTISLLVEGTGLAQNASAGKDGGTFILKANSLLTKNTSYILKISSRNSLIQKVGFKYVDNTAVSVAAFVTGDFNSDNSIDAIDLTLLVPDGMKGGAGLYDINYDGVVNSVDYSLLLINQGKKGN